MIIKEYHSGTDNLSIIDNICEMVDEMTYHSNDSYFNNIFTKYNIDFSYEESLYEIFSKMTQNQLLLCFADVSNDYIIWKLDEDNLLAQTIDILENWKSINTNLCASTELTQNVEHLKSRFVNDLDQTIQYIIQDIKR